MNVENKPFFSAVIYMSNQFASATLDSIFSQKDIAAENIQIVLALGGQNEYSEYISGLKKENRNITVCKGTYNTQAEAYSAALELVRGKYVCFPECGGAYSESTFAFMKASLEIRDIPLSIIMISTYDKQDLSKVSKALKGKPGNCDLNEKYNFPLVFLSRCFVSMELDIEINTSLAVKSVSECDFFMKLAAQTQTINVFRNKEARFYPWRENPPIFNFYEELRESDKDLKLFFDNFITANVNRCMEEFEFVPKFIQYNLILFLEWTFVVPNAEKIFAPVMSVEEFEKYFKGILVNIDDNVINNCGLLLAYKLLIYRIKYDGKMRFVKKYLSKRLYYRDMRVCDLSTNITNIEFVELEENKVALMGRMKYAGCERNEIRMYALVNGEEKVYAKDLGHSYDNIIWGRNEYPGFAFMIDIDLEGKNECVIEFFCTHKGDEIKKTVINFGKFSPLSSVVPQCYYYNKRRIIRYSEKNSSVIIKKASAFDVLKAEPKYLKSLSKTDNDYAKHAYYARILYHMVKPFCRKDIWLISDRSNKADDNGEAFFKYMKTVKNNKIKCYFVIDKESDEGKRMSKVGKTISTNSKKHKLYHLLSSYIISSQGNNPVVNPFLKGNIYYRDILCKSRFVFLQHGVTKDDISSWLNLYNRNIFGFVVTTNQEYKSIFDYDYYYKPENVWFTGFPRNDLLYHDEKRYITIMPTWRKSLMKYPDPATGIWRIRDDFKESKYYRFYNSLINDKRLIDAAKKYGYKICWKSHPIIEPYMYMFEKNDDVLFFDDDKTYREIFAESDLLLTDYSSVAFDFAYLRKPIIYTQFDREIFFSGEHSYTEGYYDYDRDGFGEIAYDLESTVDMLIDYMQNDCKIKDKYLARINDTFAFSDRNCSERVYKRLIEADK